MHEGVFIEVDGGEREIGCIWLLEEGEGGEKYEGKWVGIFWGGEEEVDVILSFVDGVGFFGGVFLDCVGEKRLFSSKLNLINLIN